MHIPIGRPPDTGVRAAVFTACRCKTSNGRLVAPGHSHPCGAPHTARATANVVCRITAACRRHTWRISGNKQLRDKLEKRERGPGLRMAAPVASACTAQLLSKRRSTQKEQCSSAQKNAGHSCLSHITEIPHTEEGQIRQTAIRGGRPSPYAAAMSAWGQRRLSRFQRGSRRCLPSALADVAQAAF